MSLVEGIEKQGVQPPRVFALTGGADVIYDTRLTNAAARIADGSKFVDPQTAVRLEVINLDAAAVKLTINGLVTAGEFHYILKAASSDGAGDGGRETFNGSFDFIKALGTAAKRISVVIHSNR